VRETFIKLARTSIKPELPVFLTGHCHKGFAVLGQNCEKTLLGSFTFAQNALAKPRRKYLMNFSWKTKPKEIFADSLKTQIQNLKKLAIFSKFQPISIFAIRSNRGQ